MYFKTLKRIQVNECYFDLSNVSSAWDVTITENLSSLYPENYRLSNTCFADAELESPEEKKDKDKHREEIKLNFKQKSK